MVAIPLLCCPMVNRQRYEPFTARSLIYISQGTKSEDQDTTKHLFVVALLG